MFSQLCVMQYKFEQNRECNNWMTILCSNDIIEIILIISYDFKRSIQLTMPSQNYEYSVPSILQGYESLKK